MYPRLIYVESLKFFGHDFGTFTLHTYGVMLALAFFAGFCIALINARREGIPADRIFDIFFYIVISGLLGAKLLHLIVEWRHYSQNPGEILFALFRLGGVYYGGLILAIAVSFFFLWRWKLSIWAMSDYLAPGLALGLSIARWGCFFAGCCFGKACNLPWAIVYTDKYTNQSVGTPLGYKLHPAPIYESIAAFTIFVILMIVVRKRSFDGETISLFLILNGIERFLIEFLRADERGYVFNGLLTTSQLVSLCIIPLGIILFIILMKRGKSLPGKMKAPGGKAK